MRIWMPTWLADAIIRRALRTPYFHLKDYMNRWWLKRPRGHGAHNDVSETNRTGWGIRVHKTLRSDNDRAHHDHPWWNISLVLKSGYWEVMADGRHIWRGPGSIVFRRATDRHRLIIPAGSPCWSLFIMGPWQRDWGFWPEWGWTYWRDYLGGLLDDTIPVADQTFIVFAHAFGSDRLYQELRDSYRGDPEYRPRYLHDLKDNRTLLESFSGHLCAILNDEYRAQPEV